MYILGIKIVKLFKKANTRKNSQKTEQDRTYTLKSGSKTLFRPHKSVGKKDFLRMPGSFYHPYFKVAICLKPKLLQFGSLYLSHNGRIYFTPLHLNSILLLKSSFKFFLSIYIYSPSKYIEFHF